MTRTIKRFRNAKDMPKRGCTLAEALSAMAGGSGVKFDETVDVAVMLGVDTKKSEQSVRGSVVLPAGSGKTTRVAVAAGGAAAEAATAAGADRVGFDDLVEDIKNGKMDFDVLIATPEAMRKLAAVGKMLGPRGLMPNPKTGTVTENTGEAVHSAKAGQVRYRADKGGIVHAAVGKASFSADDLRRNIESLLESLKKAKPAASKGHYLKEMAVSTTMGRSSIVDLSPYR